jgi:anti-sigma B factor antagonist
MGTSALVRGDGPLAVHIEQDESVLVARVVGELDIATAEFLDQELVRVSRCDAALIVLDLGAVGFIDSKGLQVLLAAAKRSRENGNRLRIRRGSKVVDRVIQLSGLEDRLPLVDR